jgi:hypothetical protein
LVVEAEVETLDQKVVQVELQVLLMELKLLTQQQTMV